MIERSYIFHRKFILSSFLFALSVFLVKDFSGLVSLLKILVLILPPILALKILTSNTIVSVSYFLIFLIPITFLPSFYQQLVSYCLILVSFLFLSVNKIAVQKNVISFLDGFSKIPLVDIFGWGFVFSSILFIGNYSEEGLIVFDTLHPSYSLSIGQGYYGGITNPINLSYSGESIKYNFFFEAFPIYLSHVFGINALNAIYFESYLFLAVIFFLVFNEFFRRYKLNKKIPLIFVLFLPTYALFFGSEVFLFKKIILFTPAYFLSYILILCAVYLITMKRDSLFFIVSFYLMNIKAMYFLVLLGGVSLFYLRLKKFKKFIKSFLLLGLIFVTSYYLFIHGAKEVGTWAIMPQYIFERLNNFYIKLPSIWILLFYAYIALHYFIKNPKEKNILLFSSMFLSGFIGFTLISESEFLSSRHFYTAGSMFGIILLIKYLDDIPKSISENYLVTFFFSAWLSTYLVFLLKNNLQLEVYSQNFYSMILAIFIILVVLLRRNKENQVRTILLIFALYGIFQISQNFFHYMSSIDRGLIQAYSWIDKNTTKDSRIFFNVFNNLQDTNFVRSALGKRQIFSEHLIYKVSKNNRFTGQICESVNVFKFLTPATIHYDKLMAKKIIEHYEDFNNRCKISPYLDKEASIERVKDFFNHNKINILVLEKDENLHSNFNSLFKKKYDKLGYKIYHYNPRIE